MTLLIADKSHYCLIDRLYLPACTFAFHANRVESGSKRPTDVRSTCRSPTAVRTAIARSGLGSGARLPAIRDLARELGVHRDTVATAYEALAADGVIESAVGRGTFVADGEAGRAAAAAPFAPALSPVRRAAARVRARAAALRQRARCGRDARADPGSLALSGRAVPARAQPRARARRTGAPALRQPAGRRLAARGARRAPARRGAAGHGRRARALPRREPGDRARAAAVLRAGRRRGARGAHLQQRARRGARARAPHRARADARGRRRSRAARADARAARGEGVLHDPDLPQPDGHHDGSRASPRAARRSRGARACP